MIEEILPNVPLNFRTACNKDDGIRLVMKSKDTPDHLFSYKIDDYLYYTPVELSEDVKGTFNIFFQDKTDNLLVATRMEIAEIIENTDGTILFSGSINGEKGTAVFTKVDNDFVFGEGGSGEVEDKYYLYWFSYGTDYSNIGTDKLYTSDNITRFVYLKNIPDFSNVQPNQTFEFYYYGKGNVVKNTFQPNEIRSDVIVLKSGSPSAYLIRVTDSTWSKFDKLKDIPSLENVEIKENKTWYPSKDYAGAGEIKVNVPSEPMKNGRFTYPYTSVTVGATCQTSKMHINNYTDNVVYLMLYTGGDSVVTKKTTIADLQSGSQTITVGYGADLNDNWRMKVKVSFESETTQQGSLQYWLKAEVLEVGSSFYSGAMFSIGCMK